MKTEATADDYFGLLSRSMAKSRRPKQNDCPRFRWGNPRVPYEDGEEEMWDSLTRGHVPSCECGKCEEKPNV